MQLPIQYQAALAVAHQATSLKTRTWPTPFFPVHHHAEQMATEAMRLNLDSAAVKAAILHDLVLMSPITLDDIERVAGHETADLVQLMTPDTRVLENPAQFDLTAYCADVARSSTVVQTLVLMDWLQTASLIGASSPALAPGLGLHLQQVATALHQAPHVLQARAAWIASWLERRPYEQQVAQYAVQSSLRSNPVANL
ncbi:hypothetical protein NQT62_07055 [Limnobacter humi]|uniref:Phosphohydrolase n=1 Tax=Limnobacter humi TaxID=1778671 RepID=A0ABT1WFB5_9BURK|nr:hypothetical protein [Limnobacter humi]MCQ8896194.1 hypothetical protein [Limnobacter humi]